MSYLYSMQIFYLKALRWMLTTQLNDQYGSSTTAKTNSVSVITYYYTLELLLSSVWTIVKKTFLKFGHYMTHSNERGIFISYIQLVLWSKWPQ